MTDITELLNIKAKIIKVQEELRDRTTALINEEIKLRVSLEKICNHPTTVRSSTYIAENLGCRERVEVYTKCSICDTVVDYAVVNKL